MSRRRFATAAFEHLAVALLACACFHEPASDSPTTNDDETTSTGSSAAMTTSVSSADTTSTSTSDAPTSDAPTGATTSEPTDPTMDGCGDDEIEIPTVELPWQGPVVIPIDGARAGPCPDALADGPRGHIAAGEIGCRCNCEGEPHELCTIRVDTSGDCMTADEPVRASCIDVTTEPVRYSVAESNCTATAMPDDVGLAVVQSCELDAMSPCAALPPGYRGPCVWSEELSCPPGFPDEIATERVACAPCGPCSTSAYCAGVDAIVWTEPGCSGDASESAVFCVESEHASLGFQANGPASCAPTTGELSSLRFCCVPM